MQKDGQGIWTITTAALDPDFYGYSYIADGIRMIDPNNSVEDQIGKRGQTAGPK